jgi:hypothetical protein
MWVEVIVVFREDTRKVSPQLWVCEELGEARD